MTSPHTPNGLIAWFIINPVAANLLMLVILAAGLATAAGLRIEGFPSMNPTTISIDVSYDSGDAHQAEEGIAIKIEEALKGMSGVKSIRSTSTTSGTSVEIERQSGYDLDQLNTDVKNRVDGIFGFPSTAEKPIVSQQQWEEDALWVSVYGDVDQRNLQQFAQQFEDALQRLPSVNKVSKSGWKTAEIAIEVDEYQLQSHNLTLNELAQRIRQESLSETSGELRSENGLILLKADKQRYRYQEFADLVIATREDGSRLTLSEIATISDGYAETPHVLSRFQGKTAINLIVRADRNADILNIADQAHTLIEQWHNDQRLPDGIELELWWDQSLGMLDRLDLILKNGLIGILLVMLVLTVFLNLKVAFWVGMGLPICFAGGLLLMGENFFDLTLNQLTTFGFVLVLGILVDDAVVVGESVYTVKEELGTSPEATLTGVQRVAIPTVYGVLTTVAAFFPLSLVEGELGTLFSQFALICTGCLLFSLLESKLILPAHLRNFDPQRKPGKHPLARGLSHIQTRADQLVDHLRQKIYRPLIARVLKHRYPVLSLFLALLILTLGLIPSGKVDFQFFPDIPEETVTISYQTLLGSGYLVAHRQAEKIEAVIETLNQQWREEHPGHPDVIARNLVLVSNDRSGTVTLELSPKNQRAISALSVADTLQQRLANAENLEELVVSADDFIEKDIELNLLSDNATELQAASTQIMQVLTNLQGVKDLHNNLTAGQPQISFDLTAEGRALGITTESLALQIQQSFYGAEVQRIQRDREEVKVRVRYPADQRRDITDLQNARIRTPEGHIVTLSTVATLSYDYTVTEIQRINGRRSASLSANIDKSVIQSGEVMAALEERAFADINARYPGLEIIIDGDDAEEAESAGSLVLIFAFSLFLIYILVAIPLKSYWQPLVIMSAIPFGMVGAIWGHWWGDIAISILSINGILALSGVVVNDCLLLVNRYNHLCDEGMDAHSAMIEAGSQRMRAILLTSLTTCLGLISLLQETSEQAQFLIPAATSLAYGISFATLVSLLLVPMLLMVANDIGEALQRITCELRQKFFKPVNAR